MSKKPGGADAFRVQLEGRLEVIEQAQALSEELTRLLGAFGWKRRVLKRASLLEAVRAREPEVAEALEGVERRGRQEQWSEEHPVRELVRELQAQRERLEGRARRRLGAGAPREGSSLAEVLDALAVAAREAPPAPKPRPAEAGTPGGPEVALGPGELLLLTGQQGRLPVSGARLWVWLLLPLASCVLAPLVKMAERGTSTGSPWPHLTSFLALGAVLVLAEWGLMRARRPGQFWLTQERLIWRPRGGRAVEVKLTSIPPTQDGVSCDFKRNQVEVGGEPRLVLPYLNQPYPLVRLLQLLRGPAASVSDEARLRVREVLILQALRGKDSLSPLTEPGVWVVRPHYAAFLPAAGRSADPATEGPRLSGVLEGVLRRMRSWTEAEFDELVRGAAHEREGSLWTDAEVREVLPTLPVTHCRLVDSSGRRVEGDLSVKQRETLLGMFQPRQTGGPARIVSFKARGR